MKAFDGMSGTIIENAMLTDCWIAPDGTIIDVTYGGHSGFARSYFRMKNEDNSDAVSTLEKMGWIHVSGGWIAGQRHMPEPTSAQYDVLWDMARLAQENALGYFASEFRDNYRRLMEKEF